MNVDQTIVVSELERILHSRCFRSRKTLCQLMEYLTQQYLIGNTEQLSQYNIAVNGLSKSTDFDATIDPIVRIQIGRLRHQLKDYYATEGRFNPIRISLPSRSYQLIITPVETSPLTPSNPNNIPIALEASPILSLSQGPNIVCIPRNFAIDNEKNWLFICSITRDYVIALSHFIHCQTIFAEEQPWQQRDYAPSNWLQYQADFALFFDLYKPQQQYELKCTLVSRVNQQIIWAHKFTVGKQYPSIATIQMIFKRIAHDTVSLEKGLAQDFWVRQLLDSGKPIASHCQIVVDTRQYSWNISQQNFAKAVKNAERRLADYPHDTIALISFADFCRSEYLLKFNEIQNYYQRTSDISELLLQIAPQNPYSHFFYALACLFQDRFDDSEKYIQNAYNINNVDSHLNNLIGLLYIGLGQWEKGSVYIQDCINISPIYPDWYHIALCVYHYREGNYLTAMQEAQRIKLKHLWSPMIRAALYQHGGWQDKSKQEYQHLEHDYPSFKQDSYKLLHGFHEKAGGVIKQLWSSAFSKHE